MRPTGVVHRRYRKAFISGKGARGLIIERTQHTTTHYRTPKLGHSSNRSGTKFTFEASLRDPRPARWFPLAHHALQQPAQVSLSAATSIQSTTFAVSTRSTTRSFTKLHTLSSADIRRLRRAPRRPLTTRTRHVSTTTCSGASLTTCILDTRGYPLQVCAERHRSHRVRHPTATNGRRGVVPAEISMLTLTLTGTPENHRTKTTGQPY